MFLIQPRLEPLIDALGMKDMQADRNLADGDALLEFLKEDHTLCLLIMVDALIIWALYDKFYESIDDLFLVLNPAPYLVSHLYLVVRDLVLELPLPYAHHNDSSHADEFETETENEEDEGDGPEDGILVNFCRVSLDNDFHGLVPL
jgi:hypothetical protein